MLLSQGGGSSGGGSSGSSHGGGGVHSNTKGPAEKKGMRMSLVMLVAGAVVAAGAVAAVASRKVGHSIFLESYFFLKILF